MHHTNTVRRYVIAGHAPVAAWGLWTETCLAVCAPDHPPREQSESALKIAVSAQTLREAFRQAYRSPRNPSHKKQTQKRLKSRQLATPWLYQSAAQAKTEKAQQKS